ncbi:MAG: hypothetical protein OXG87_05340 [Gemmatimonadetes bacterium]|nr:hypothetical protein [Gemmatimonadota bacterium]
MARIATIVLVLSVFLPQALLAGVVLKAGKIDSSNVEVGAYAEVIYGTGKRDQVSGKWEKLDTVEGYIKAVDQESLTIGRGFWKEQITFERIQKLILAESYREIDRLKETTDSLSVRKVNRRETGLMFEVGWNQGINTSSRNIFSGYTSYLDRRQKAQEGLPWSLSFYFGRMISGERSSRFGLKYTRQVVQILPINPNGFPPQPRDGKTYKSLSLLLVHQRVVKRSPRVVMLADFAVGIALINNYFNSDSPCNYLWDCAPEIGSRYSAGMAFLLPSNAHIGLQATVRADLLRVKHKYPFTSGISVALGLLWE